MKKIITDKDKETLKTAYISTTITLLVLSICLYIIDDKSNPQISKLNIYISRINFILSFIYLAIYYYKKKTTKCDDPN